MGFVVFSHFRLLGLFEEFIEDNISPLGWGTMFQVPKVSEGICILALPYSLLAIAGRPAARTARPPGRPPFSFEHLTDLEHGPPPEGGNVILDEFFK